MEEQGLSFGNVPHFRRVSAWYCGGDEMAKMG